MATDDKPDIDPLETQEWLQALDAAIEYNDKDRACALIGALTEHARALNVPLPYITTSPYKNSIPTDEQGDYPGDLTLENRIEDFIRWNAMAMVVGAGKQAPELGGHIATFASAATLYSVLFNHCAQAASKTHGGDLVFVQGHSSPGIYARAFLEGRLTPAQVKNFRQEAAKDGLSSYPHPWLMPDFWQFPTVSMGLGPIQGIFQARFLKYLHHRDLIDATDRKVWVFCGDGEMDEPESLGSIGLASREKLDNLIFVINCNLQRLDGPVRGNSKIIQELESIFHGAGWQVLKVVWGDKWDPLLAKDTSGLLLKRMQEAVDGDYQNYAAHGGAYMREHFFGKYPELLTLVEDLSDDELAALNRGGHDPQKVHAAYQKAMNTVDKPTVILTKSVKGYGLGAAGESLNIAHNVKKMSADDLKAFAKRFDIDLTEPEIEKVALYRPKDDSPEIQYLQSQRKALGGYLPARRVQSDETLTVPDLSVFDSLLKGTGEQRQISTTMAFVRILSTLLKDKTIGDRIVPIVPDESRTFGMEGLFRQVGIYSPVGQLYTPVDAKQVMSYREAKDGQILQEGLNEAGAFCSWLSAGTAYSNHNRVMIPFYIYYSMFGFQRIGDLAWAAGDMCARGFLLGGTAGRTSLPGEGLQHQDGHSHVLAGTIANCVTYDPAFAYELAVIIQAGLYRMVQCQENVFYYITVTTENYAHPAMPADIEAGITKGLYEFSQVKAKKAKGKKVPKAQLLGSGGILREAIQAAELLANDYAIDVTVWSAPSFNELGKEARACARDNRLHPSKTAKKAYVTECLEKQKDGVIVAATDYICAYADQIRAYIPQPYVVLGTDGFGRSDTRVELRRFFEVDYRHIAYATLTALHEQGDVSLETVKKAAKALEIDSNKPCPTTV